MIKWKWICGLGVVNMLWYMLYFWFLMFFYGLCFLGIVGVFIIKYLKNGSCEVVDKGLIDFGDMVIYYFF